MFPSMFWGNFDVSPKDKVGESVLGRSHGISGIIFMFIYRCNYTRTSYPRDKRKGELKM